MAPHNKMYALITVHSMLNYCMRPLIPPLAEFIAVRLAIFTAPPHRSVLTATAMTAWPRLAGPAAREHHNGLGVEHLHPTTHWSHGRAAD